MAYALRYYKELTHPDGTVYRLEIHEKDGTASAMEIGKVVQGLRLDVQGDTEIDAPIVKTSLTMTFVDAPDHADAKTKKCGNWEEFYTSDATKWKVVMKYRKAGGASFVTMWGGYITPDSYTETLVYRGSVTIIARDNIGHMQDFPFDAEGNADGLISLKQLISGAWAKIESPMSLVLRDSGDAMWMYTDGVAAYDTMMNVSALMDKNWLEALEDALYAYGVVMRYVGDNNVSIMPLRSLPMMGEASFDDVPTAEPVFMTGAERELVPSVRRIEESIEFDTVDNVPMPQLTDSDFTGTSGEYTCEIEGVEIDGQKFGTSEHQAPVWPISNKTGKNWANPSESTTLFFRPAYDIGYFSTSYEEEIRRYMYIAANNKDERVVKFRKNIQCADMCITIKFGTPIGLNRNTQIERAVPVNLFKITYAVTLEQNGITEYYKGYGNWVVDAYQHTVEYDATQPTDKFTTAIEMDDHAGDALLTLHIYKIEYKQTSLMNLIRTGLYACIQSLTFDVPQSSAIVTKNSVNTNYDAKNNVILSRDVKIAPAMNTVSIPSAIRNGIFTQSGDSYIPAKLWYWGGGTSQQMAVYNHLQLLCYHAKPNSVIRGTIVNADLAKMSVIYSWQGLEMMLVSGSLNFISGYLENAVLREFARYEDMWGTLDETELPAVEGGTATTADGGGSGSGNSASVTNVTEVYIGGEGGTITLDTYMSDSSENGVQNKVIKAYVDGEVKEVADLLTSMWRIEDNKIVTDMDVLIKANLIIEGDTSSGGEGQDTPASGIRGIYVNGTPYTDDDGDGFIDLGTISGGGGVSGDYLPLSGGTIASSSTDTPLTIKNNNTSGAWIGFDNSYGNLGYIGYTYEKKLHCYDENGVARVVLHTNNIGSYALPLSGGTISGTVTFSSANPALILHRASGTSYMRFGASASLEYGEIGVNGSGDAVFWSLISGNSAYNAWHTLIHSGNIGSYAPTYDASKNVTIDNQLWVKSYLNINRNGSTGALYDASRMGIEIEPFASYFVLKGYNTSGKGVGGIFLNSSGNITLGGSDLARTTYKMSVDGKVHIRATAGAAMTEGAGSLIVGNGAVLMIDANDIQAKTNGTTAGPLYINDWGGNVSLCAQNKGNVLIGTAEDSGYKLDVYGTGRFKAASASDNYTALRLTNAWYGGSGKKNTDIVMESSVGYRGGIIRCTIDAAYGNFESLSFGAGSNGASSYIPYLTISSAGNVTIAKNLIVSGDTSSGSDIRFKDIIKDKTLKIEDIAKAPLFTFKWNDREDNAIHLGSSAQYWEKVCPWLVSGSDFKSLNYATLGVAMGISLAKKAVNHEERIKELEREIKRLKEEMRYGDR